MPARRIFVFGAALALAVPLAGCNEAQPVAAAPPPPQPAQFADLPHGAPCTEKINHYQWVLTADRQTGNVNESVYQTIEQELSAAAAACAAGNNGEALALVRQSETRHGYHT